jgi:hypothetical protein
MQDYFNTHELMTKCISKHDGSNGDENSISIKNADFYWKRKGDDEKTLKAKE